MRSSRTLAGALLLAGLPASAGDLERRTWTFEGETPGSIASGFTGASGEWKVVATDEGKALAQLAESPDRAFNLTLVDGIRPRDVDLSVRIKAVAGENDQGGGLVWRARDAGMPGTITSHASTTRRTTSASTRSSGGSAPRRSRTPS